MIKNYFFDFDKTLASTGDVSVTAMKLAFQNAGLAVPPTDVILNYMGIPAEISVKEMAEESLSDQRVQAICNDFRTIYARDELKSTILYPGIAKMLAALEAQGKHLFIVSSKQTDAVKRNLQHLGIQKYFLEAIGCDLVKHYKPAPDGILILLDRYHLSKDDSVMIGDAKYDLQMGQAAGVKTCGVTWGAFDVPSLQREHPTYLLDEPAKLVTIK